METNEKTAEEVLMNEYSRLYAETLSGQPFPTVPPKWVLKCMEEHASNQTASLRKEIEERDKEIERLKGLADGKAAGWISVKDRLPEVGDNVLMILRGQKQTVIPGYYGHNNGFYAWGTNMLEHDNVKVLYWTLFPSPPSDNSQE